MLGKREALTLLMGSRLRITFDRAGLLCLVMWEDSQLTPGNGYLWKEQARRPDPRN
jgi:hypothetical protein